MSGDKIENLNKAVEDMLDNFAQEEKMETEILVSVITFGNQVELQVPYIKASQVQWQGLQANGMTPMGTALKMAKAMIEDKETTCPVLTARQSFLFQTGSLMTAGKSRWRTLSPKGALPNVTAWQWLSDVMRMRRF